MEKQKLPNATIVLIFGILSILGCCCWGIVGIIFGGIALYLAKKDTALYTANPELYYGYDNLKTGKILAIIGLVLSIASLIYTIYIFSTVGIQGYEIMLEEFQKGYEQGSGM